jgi:hypothetical protein
MAAVINMYSLQQTAAPFLQRRMAQPFVFYYETVDLHRTGIHENGGNQQHEHQNNNTVDDGADNSEHLAAIA